MLASVSDRPSPDQKHPDLVIPKEEISPSCSIEGLELHLIRLKLRGQDDAMLLTDLPLLRDDFPGKNLDIVTKRSGERC